MSPIIILNIPNFYSTYYLYGFHKIGKVNYKSDSRFLKYNNKPLLIFEFEGKIGVIDNDDPKGVSQDLLALCDVYFATNKLKNNSGYQAPKIVPLFPHYPINIIFTYLKLFHINLLKKNRFKDVLKELYTQFTRPLYTSYSFSYSFTNYVFFSSRIWKKEEEANAIRASYIRFCKADQRIQFEGGLMARQDGDNFNYNDILNDVKYSPKKFSELSAKSLVAFNNPAVLDAVSWRLAEYLNQGLFVISLPFKIDLPVAFTNKGNICFIDSVDELAEVFDAIYNDKEYHKKICTQAKSYFETYCTPEQQCQFILNEIRK